MNSEVLVTFKGDTKDLDKKTKEASGVLSGFAKTLGGVVAGAGSIASASLIATGKAVIDLTKASVNSYAEYEQLIGGVETLFKESAGQLEEYANEAYKTAGISANQYMEQATSFSARLIKDTGGDTARVTELVNLAITDMSDNANKMGTSMEAIQSAYQGLAKGNATMLDNLKVGYGGTSTEMLKLAKDMGIVSQEVQSFQDMTFEEAILSIHKVQEQLGITGTTAQEASTTISGSFNMMKASWGNLLTELAKPEGDIENALYNIIDSALTFVHNISPIIVTAIKGIAEALPTLAQEISYILPQLIDNLLPPLIDAVISLVQSIAQNLPSIILSISNALVQAIIGLSKVLPQILDALLKATITIIIALAQALPDMIPALIDAILGMIPVLIENLPLFIQAGIELLLGLITGIIKAIPELLKQTKNIVKAIINAFKDLPMALWNAGKDMIKGLWNGIKDVTGWITNKIKGFGNSVMKAIKGIFGIHSPSTEFAWVGKMNILGLEKGMEDMQPQLQRTINGMFDLQPNVSGSMTNSLSPNLNVVVNNNMEVDPIGQVVNKIKTFSGGAKNDYNWGATQ